MTERKRKCKNIENTSGNIYGKILLLLRSSQLLKKKKKKECKFSEHFEIQPSSDFVHQTIEWFICTCYSKIHPRISEKFFLASFRVNDPLWRWFLFESKNKRDKGGGRRKGKNWHPLCTHPNSPSGKLILNSKVRAVGLPPLMRSIPFILR